MTGSRINIGVCADRCRDEEIRERVRIPVDDIGSADVVGSNPTGPTSSLCSSG